MKNIFYTLTLGLFLISTANAGSLIGRLGLGYSNHLESEMPTLSLKLQRNRSTALGGNFGLDSSSEGTFYAFGFKFYRYIYEEPQLNFYSALGLNIFTYNNEEKDKTEQGNQIDGTFGTEFSFQGIESVGFSFEFGMSFSKYQGESHLKTVGNSMIKSAVHFYL